MRNYFYISSLSIALTILAFGDLRPCFCQTIDDYNSIIAQYRDGSPSGGPDKNTDAVVLVFFRKSNKLGWLEVGKLVTVDIQPPVETDDKQEFGPTPLGEYLIGTRYLHEKNNCDWYRLYPRKEDNSGYYGYDQKNKSGRNTIGLHPGTVSEGCVTVKNSWESVRKHVDAGKLEYKDQDYTGILYVGDK